MLFSPLFFWSVCSRFALDLTFFVVVVVVLALIVSEHSNKTCLDVPSGTFVLNFGSGWWAAVLPAFLLWWW